VPLSFFSVDCVMLWQSFFITRLLDTYNVTDTLIFQCCFKTCSLFFYLLLFLVNVVIVHLVSC